jgi:hypothetical protein
MKFYSSIKEKILKKILKIYGIYYWLKINTQCFLSFFLVYVHKFYCNNNFLYLRKKNSIKFFSEIIFNQILLITTF